jgi:hypothetical protein
LREETIEISEARDISSHARHVSSDFPRRRSQLRLAAARDEGISAFAHEPLRRREADAAGTAGHERDFSVELAHA